MKRWIGGALVLVVSFLLTLLVIDRGLVGALKWIGRWLYP